MDDLLNTGAGDGNSVSADSTPSDSAHIPDSGDVINADANTDADTTGTVQNDESDEITDSEEVTKVLAEHKPEETQIPITRKLRQIIAAKDKELTGLKSQTPEYSETDKAAIDLYKALTSFDVEKGVPTSKPFAQAIVQKDAKLAVQIGKDLYGQVLDPATGKTVGHELLGWMGLDPNRLDDLRKFSRGEVQFDGAVPSDVPPEFGAAFKSLHKVDRDTTLYNLVNGDEDEKTAALERLRDRQERLDYKTQTERETQESAQRTAQEIETRADSEELETFNTFTDSFKESPTYKTATVSGNPQLDEGIKSVVSMAILGTAYPGTVFGAQSMKFFESLGVKVDADKILESVAPVSSSIKTSIVAEKGGYLDAKANALATKQDSLDRLSGLRNKIFTDALNVLSGYMKAVSEANGDILEQNGGIPTVDGNGHGGNGAGSKVNTLDLVNQISAQLSSK